MTDTSGIDSTISGAIRPNGVGAITATVLAGVLTAIVTWAVASFGGLNGANTWTGANAFNGTLAFGSSAGLQFSLAPGLIGDPAGSGIPTNGGSGYALGDTVTVACAGVTFTRAPILGVYALGGGSDVGQFMVLAPGVATSNVAGGVATCTQTSTSGGGSGIQVKATLGVVASNISVPALTLGGSLRLNNGDTGISGGSGPENTLFGDKAGFGLLGTSGYNVAIGHNSGGSGGGAGVGTTGDANTFVGNDAARNISGAADRNTFVGSGSGRNVMGSFNVALGTGTLSNAAANSTGALNATFNTALGINAGYVITTGSGNTMVGANAGKALTTGSNDLYLVANNSGSDICGNGASESNVAALCAGAGRLLTITGGGTPATSAASVAGTLTTGAYTVATLPASPPAGSRAYVTDAASCASRLGTLTGGGSTFCPTIYDGSTWRQQ